MKETILSIASFFSDTVWDLFPNSPVAFLIYLGGFTLFCVLLIFYFAKRSNKKTEKKTEKKELTIDDLIKIANNPKSGVSDLLAALKLYNGKFVVAMDKEKSIEFLKKVLNHKHREKVLFDYFHGSILPKNITFRDVLDKLEKEALNK